METGLLIIIELTIIFLSVVLIHKNKINKNKLIDRMVDKISINDLDIDDCFSTYVLDYYKRVLTNPEKFSKGHCVIQEDGNKIEVWTQNDIIHRRFYTNEKALELEVEEINSKLTHYDRVLLDKISEQIEKNNKILIKKFFV